MKAILNSISEAIAYGYREGTPKQRVKLSLVLPPALLLAALGGIAKEFADWVPEAIDSMRGWVWER